MGSKISKLFQWPKRISLPSWSSFLRPQARNLIALVILVLALPVTVFVAQQQQEIRQRAAINFESSCIDECDEGLDFCKNLAQSNRNSCHAKNRENANSCTSSCNFLNDDQDRFVCYTDCITASSNEDAACSNSYNTDLNNCVGRNNSCKLNCSREPICDIEQRRICGSEGKTCVIENGAQKCVGGEPKGGTPKTGYGTPGDGYGTPPDESCPKSGDNCTYSESDGQCYSGHTDNKKKEGFNKGDCDYSCGPITCPSDKSKSDKPIIDCTPGEQVKSFDDLPCPKGKSGTCAGHSYCEYHSDGNRETDPICETASETCFDKDSDRRGGTSSSSSSCQAELKGDKITNSCLSCLTKDRKGLVSEIKNLNSELFSSCSNNEIVQFWCSNGISKEANEDCAQAKMSCGSACGFRDGEKEKKKKQEQKKRDEKKKRDQTGNSRRKPKEKEIPTITFSPSATTKPGGPSATPRPQEITPTLTPSPTPSPTPLPPLPAVKGLKADCGRTNDPTRPLGLEVTWSPVSGNKAYALRIDEDTPSWGEDFVNPGDTISNDVKETRFAREAKPLSSYRIWVHAINQSGVYSEVLERLIVTCISLTPTPSKSGTGQTIGAGKIIILPKVTPASNAAAATPTAKP